MNCQACATPNEDGRRFCKACGQPLSIVCDECGGTNTPDARFCGECGGALTTRGSIRLPSVSAATDVASPGPATTTERRLVSVLFVDLVGSTALAEHRDAEEVRELLGQYFDAARDAIERHGGLVEKFIGDAVMAVWGTPVAHEDDAERAVRAAFEVVEAVQVLGREVGVALNARAGVLTGEAAATVGAVHQGIVAGDLVNTASRIQSAAEPGRVLVGEATYRAANRAIAFEEMGELTLKGKDEVVRAWRALRVVGDVGGANRGPRTRAAVRRQGRGAPRAQGGVARDRPRGQGPDGLDRRDRWHGQVPARLGAREVRRRALRSRLLAPGPVPRVRRRRSASGPWPRWFACAPGSPSSTTHATARTKLASSVARTGSRRRRTTVVGASPRAPVGARRRRVR